MIATMGAQQTGKDGRRQQGGHRWQQVSSRRVGLWQNGSGSGRKGGVSLAELHCTASKGISL